MVHVDCICAVSVIGRLLGAELQGCAEMVVRGSGQKGCEDGEDVEYKVQSVCPMRIHIDVRAAVLCEISASGRDRGGFVVGVAMCAIAEAWLGQMEVADDAGVDDRHGRRCGLVAMWFIGGEAIVAVVYGSFVAQTGKSATSDTNPW